MKSVIACKRTGSMCRNIFIPWRIHDSPSPSLPASPYPAPSHALRRGKWEVLLFDSALFDSTNMMLALIAKNYSERGDWVMSIDDAVQPYQYKAVWKSHDVKWVLSGLLDRGRLYGVACKQSRSSAKLIYTSYPPSFCTIHLKCVSKYYSITLFFFIRTIL